jgi:hypothetical protein
MTATLIIAVGIPARTREIRIASRAARVGLTVAHIVI